MKTAKWIGWFGVCGLLALPGCHPNESSPGVLATAAAPEAAEIRPALPPLFRDIERRTFQYFWDTSHPVNGLAPDRYPSRPFASIAAQGFALTAYPIGVENGWVDRAQAARRTLTALTFLRDLPAGPDAQGRGAHHGFYYHFLDLEQGTRFADWVELSSVDTALLMMGVLFAQSYYDGDDATEVAIRDVADILYRRVDWTALQRNHPLLSMGWFPESGIIEHDWAGYNEAMIVYLLALGSPTHPIEADAWAAWTFSYDLSWGDYHGHEHLSFGPMFGHQYSHVWIDFRGIQDDYMRARGLDYFENSRRAAYAQQAYAIANAQQWAGYGEHLWGLTASDGPQQTLQAVAGQPREFRHYSARGAGLRDAFDDGTIAPTASLGSLVFAPELVIPTALSMHERYGEHLYSSYGFLDAFNPSFEFDVPLQSGRVVPGVGWFASDYIGIDQGPILTMISNYRNEFVWSVMKRNPYLRQGLTKAGFRGGWLETPVADAQTRGAAAAGPAAP